MVRPKTQIRRKSFPKSGFIFFQPAGDLKGASHAIVLRVRLFTIFMTTQDGRAMGLYWREFRVPVRIG